MTGLLTGNSWTGKIYNGQWVGSTGGTAEVSEPATGAMLAEVGLGNAADVERASREASEAQSAWAQRIGPERAAILREAAKTLERHHEEVERWLIRESGSVPGKAAFEVQLAQAELWEAAALPTQPWGHLLPASQDGRHSAARRLPLGVVGIISPWNFPFLLAIRAVAPALALGNAVVLKPDVQTAVVGGTAIAQLFHEAGLPEGLLQVLAGDAEPGQALCEDPNIAMVSFTGSTSIGREVASAAGRNLKRVSLELGGNNALIVLDDADVDTASSAGAWSAYLHQGQICMTAGRHIVVESVADEYLDLLSRRAAALRVGDPNREEVALGPLINESQIANVERVVNETVSSGAELRAGGKRDALFYRPTVLGGVTAEMPAFREEIFGPVAPVTVVRDEEEAIAVANDTDRGLVAAVQTSSAERGNALANQLRTGIVHVNDQTLNNDAYAPFGGTGMSGNGSRFGSQSSWDEFTEWQWLTSRSQARQYPF
ncbi:MULTISPECIES: benzaldehyde dehydrogenase [Actinopolyspora]|uniref:Benzaldehyde dehydrogenase (NAD+) n=1 Tax=Actinopolyspora saharensis TaxID=995062 RepID=A0A1H0YKZ1_9ACTN|nr:MULTISPECIES: benzaldehyde dehydrogenase [Actinopolyspora]NHD19557.1 benzaldehyde dehydrogenase [Actinopolyspora sp. BKK2]NHE78695.1 benzaldehyde dehydrogenase [Actinopolyspora sp. BKK1]SDQ15853.1 benzaldehyde dehydrogenase (NAD+) [Actinopolyspora saharensis]